MADEKTAPMFPMVHLNGTSKGELKSQLQIANNALTNADDALRQAAPNGRDYYPKGPDAYGIARKQHDSRLERLAEIKAEIMSIWTAIDNRD